MIPAVDVPSGGDLDADLVYFEVHIYGVYGNHPIMVQKFMPKKSQKTKKSIVSDVTWKYLLFLGVH